MNEVKSNKPPIAPGEKLKFAGGKYKGIPVCEVPSSNLLFMRVQNKAFEKECERVLRERGNLPEPTVPRIEEIIIAGQQALAKKYHPECGGTEQEMKEVEVAANALFEVVKETK